jgi:hypothetical protein
MVARRPLAAMRRTATGAALAAALPAAAEEAIAVPSGQHVTLAEVIWGAPGPEGLTARFRFLAPQVGAAEGGVDFETALGDMDYLCTAYALPRVVTGTGPVPAQIVISLMDRPVPFGASMPEATQYFESYRIDDGICIWEEY